MEMTVITSTGIENSMRPGKGKSMGSIDRISDLPDDVLAHILSFLSITEAIRTCILSKKWKNIWCDVPVLEFDFEKFCQDRGLSYRTAADRNEIFEKGEVKYESFVQGVLQNREACLDKFKLHWPIWSPFPRESFTKVILQAIKLKPRVFSVSVWRHSLNFNLDPVFNCASLEEVTLRELLSFKAPDSINLPCLKRLNISFQSIDDDFINKVLLGCPILEEMLLYRSNLYLSRISSNRLKKLIFEICYIDEGRLLEISTPSLLHLEIAYKSGLHSISPANLTSLTNASIDLQLPRGSKHNDLTVLNCLSNVTTLVLRIQGSRKSVVKMKENIKGDTSNHPSFANLKSLRVEWFMDYFGFDLIAFFLQHSPNLQKLTIELYNYFKSVTKEGSSLEEPKDILFRRERLETVMIVRNKSEESKKIADQLVNSLNGHVNTIGEIITKIKFSILRLGRVGRGVGL